MANKYPDIDTWQASIRSGDRRALSRAITLAESRLPEDQQVAMALISGLSRQNKSITVAITGPPGVGKSTFIESISKTALQQDRKIAVLSIDPTSQISSGSILGDKTRMAGLSNHEKAYVRPSPSGGVYGGVGGHTHEARSLCEAAGYSLIFIETVGIGQSESDVQYLCDMMVLLHQPGSGDELQTMKRGIMELADLHVINKSDGDLLSSARTAKSNLIASIRLSDEKPNPVLMHSSLDSEGSQECYESIMRTWETLYANGVIEERRKTQDQYWFQKKWREYFFNQTWHDSGICRLEEHYLDQINLGELPLYHAIPSMIKRLRFEWEEYAEKKDSN